MTEGFLARRCIAISVSDSPHLAGLGFGPDHVTEALTYLSRQVILLGGSLAYGGDLRPGGFTEALLELAASLRPRDWDVELGDRPPLVQSYLAWSRYLDLTEARELDLSATVKFHKLPEATGQVADLLSHLPAARPDRRLITARNHTAARVRMAEETDARIVLGGKTHGWGGVIPGVAEEALETLGAGKPLYVLGAFGGAASLIAEALDGGEPAALTRDEHDPGDGSYRELLQQYAAAEGRERSPETVAKLLRGLGWEGLGRLNGLSAEENRRLAVTPHGVEMWALVLKGLKTAWSAA